MVKIKNKPTLFYRQDNQKKIKIAAWKKRAQDYKILKSEISLGKDISDIRISKLKKNKYHASFLSTKKYSRQLNGGLITAKFNFSGLGEINKISDLGMIVPEYKHKKQRVLYIGGKKLSIAYSKNLKNWQISPQPIFQLREEILGRSSLKIGQIFNLRQGILVVCFRYQQPGDKENYSYQLVLFDKNQPDQEIWRKQVPIQGKITVKKLRTAFPFGLIKQADQLISYWNINNEKIYFLGQPFFKFKKSTPPSPFPYQEKLKKYPNNPILEPISENSWESKLVFNPAAFNEEDNVHLIYRAVGEDDVSVLGYASSKDGLEIDYRQSKPAYIPQKQFEVNPQAPQTSYTYTSPWGSGGCEDPKLTRIKNKVYMTYTAWNGIDPPGVALTSIRVNDLVKREWNWEEPIMISPPGEIHKNWALFPDKIKGKYAIIHSLSPKILVDYFDDLKFDSGRYINSYYSPSGRKNHWDNWLRGTGPPPIKTEDGWLLLYHAMDNRDPGRYKMGAMVLDHKDPTKINYRSNNPLLEPDEWYENQGFKSGVVYSCGAVVKNKHLLVYYGGADTVSCVAHIKLKKLLNGLKNQKQVELNPAAQLELTN